MSRRSDKRAPVSPSAVADQFVEIVVVCTGKGLHPRLSFGKAQVYPALENEPGRGVSMDLKVDSHMVDTQIEDWSDPQAALAAIQGSHFTDTLRCHRCQPTRNVPWTRATAEALFIAYAKDGRTTLDISARR